MKNLPIKRACFIWLHAIVMKPDEAAKPISQVNKLLKLSGILENFLYRIPVFPGKIIAAKRRTRQPESYLVVVIYTLLRTIISFLFDSMNIVKAPNRNYFQKNIAFPSYSHSFLTLQHQIPVVPSQILQIQHFSHLR